MSLCYSLLIQVWLDSTETPGQGSTYHAEKMIISWHHLTGLHHAHLDTEQNFQDDTVSLGYILMGFKRTSLPWQRLQRRNKHEKIGERTCLFLLKFYLNSYTI